MVYLYILQSQKDKGYYIGITNNKDKRLEKHNKGGVTSTKNRRPFVMIYAEQFDSYKAARVREIEVKSYKGGNSFKQLISKYCGIV